MAGVSSGRSRTRATVTRAAAGAAARRSSAASRVRAYLAALPPDARRAAKTLRGAIKAAAPGASEHFSYGIPGFTLGGRPLAWYAVFARHASMYPFSAAFARAHGIDLGGREMSKGTVRFPLDEAIPVRLVAQLVKARARGLAAPRTR